MNELEDRVRRALRTDVRGVGSEQLLADVHQGVGRRMRRRTAVVVAASALIVVGVAGIAFQLRGDEGTSPSPAPTTPVLPTPSQPVLPDGATEGVVDVSVVSGDRWFRLTANVGCVGCSTVWQNEQSAEGGWERLHDFPSRDRATVTSGPVTSLVMAVDGVDGWAWGERLYATHDGGRTWTAVTTGPGRVNGDYGHQVRLTDQYAWSLLRTNQGLELWRTELGADDWSRADAPNMSGVSAMVTTSSRVVLETSDEGLANPRIQYSTDGSSWSELANPCPGENEIHPGESALFILCPEGESGATVYRSVDVSPDLSAWKVFGRSEGVITAVVGLDDDTLLVVGEQGRANVLLASGRTRTVDLGLSPGEEVFGADAPWSGDLVLLATSEHRLIGSDDRGGTWHAVE